MGIRAEFIEPIEEELVKLEHGEQCEPAVFDLSGGEGAYHLPREFRAKDDETGQCSVNEERTGDATRDTEEEDEALESYP